MAVMRVEKNGNYTVMSNYHLRDHRLSLKAKGLLSVMLSLPVEWDFTLFGLASISKEGIDAIRAAVNELVKAGYIIRAKVRNAAGQLVDMEYTIYELPQGDHQDELQQSSTAVVSQQDEASWTPTLEKPTLGKPTLASPMLENPTQLNTDIRKKDKSITDTSNPDQSSTDPSIPEIAERSDEGVRTQVSTESAGNSSPALLSQTQRASGVHLGQPEGLTVQQMYMTEETSIPGMRRRLSYDAFIRKVKRQIDYWDLMDGSDKDEIENIVSIMVEVLSTQCEFFTISGKKYPADLVHQRFSEINSGHIEYVLECFHKCGSDIRNIKQYLIAALFNAPATYSSYYGAAVRRDCEWLRQ